MGADEGSVYIAEHMNRYFGINVLKEAADSPDNWKSDETTKIKFYCDDTAGDQAGLCDRLRESWLGYVRRVLKPSIPATI